MSFYIQKKACQLIQRCATRDPFAIAQGIGITVRSADLGQLKGLYTVVRRNRYIVLNETMPERMRKIVCAHELGHDQLHRELAKNTLLQEFMLYRMDEQPEYEANMFAANILLPDAEVLEYVYEHRYSADQIARIMDSDINLVALKMAYLAQQGHNFNKMEYQAAFLKK